MNGLKKSFTDNFLIYLFTIYLFVYSVYQFIYLIMRVGFEIKGSKPKSSVNRLNLFKVLIVSSTSFLQECAICSSDSSSSFSSSPSVITSAGCSENSETIYSTRLVGLFNKIYSTRLVGSK